MPTPGLRRLLWLAAAIVFVDTMFFAAIVPLLPDLTEELDLSKTAAGVLSGAYAAGTLIGALPGAWAAARLGVRPVVVAGLALMSVTSVAFALADQVVVLDVARFIQGLGGAATWAGALSWLVRTAPAERRGELIGTALAAAIAGSLFGPVLGGVAGEAGRGPVFAAVAVVGAVLIVFAALMPAPPPGVPGRIRDVGRLRHATGAAVGAMLLCLAGLMFGTMDVLAPLRLDVLGASGVAIAVVFLVAAGLEATVSPISGRTSDRIGRIGPVVPGLVLSAALMTALTLPGEAWLVALLVIAAAPSIGLLWAPAMAMLSDAAEAIRLDQAFAFGVVNLTWAIGQSTGTIGGAAVGDALGDPVAYLSLAGLCLAGLAVVLRSPLARAAPEPT